MTPPSCPRPSFSTQLIPAASGTAPAPTPTADSSACIDSTPVAVPTVMVANCQRQYAPKVPVTECGYPDGTNPATSRPAGSTSAARIAPLQRAGPAPRTRGSPPRIQQPPGTAAARLPLGRRRRQLQEGRGLGVARRARPHILAAPRPPVADWERGSAAAVAGAAGVAPLAAALPMHPRAAHRAVGCSAQSAGQGCA